MYILNRLPQLQILFISAFFSVFLFPNPDITEKQKELLEQLPPDQRNSVMDKMANINNLQEEVDEKFENPNTLVERPDPYTAENTCEECIFGYDFFQFSPSTFAPTDNIAVSSDYVLGAGDLLEISLYGNQSDKSEGYIGRDGFINVPLIGPIQVAGLTYDEAKELLQQRVETELIGTSIFISLVELRSISFYILGQAYKPGKYTVSGLSSVTNALFISGGVNENGSLRNISLKRGNKEISTYDFYDFLLKGSLESDLPLKDGDVIFVPFISDKIKIGGAVNRPHLYELKDGENLKQALDFAGGFKSDVLPSSSIEISSIDDDNLTRNIKSYNLGNVDFNMLLKDGDSINVNGVSGLDIQTIKVSGEVKNPGEYSLLDGDTILEIINKAGGYTKEAFPEGAVFTRKSSAKRQKEAFLRSADELERTMVNIVQEATTEASTTLNEFSLLPISQLIIKLREAEPLGREVVDLDIFALRSDPYKNFRVRGGDELFIPKRPNSVSVVGEVLSSSTLRFNPNLSIDGYIELSGGTTQQADENRIYVISPSGKSQIIKNNIFQNKNLIIPGSTIVVPRTSKAWDAISITKIVTPILADLATSAAAIAAISD